MSDEDKALIKSFIKNKPMADAVRRALLKGTAAEFDDPNQHWIMNIDLNLPDDEYVSRVKNIVRANVIIENTFAQLKHVASSNPQVAPVNEAR